MIIDTMHSAWVWLATYVVGALAQSNSTSNSTSDFDTFVQRRLQAVAQTPLVNTWAPTISFNDVDSWISTLRPDGSWPDVNYLSGCNASRANWEAMQHLERVLGLAEIWSGLNDNVTTTWKANQTVWNAALSSLGYWFANDYTDPQCLGGTESWTTCKCNTTGLWNSNWYYQTIGEPLAISPACLLLGEGNLTDTQRTNCLRFSIRGSPYSDQVGREEERTGTNGIWIYNNVINSACFSRNESLLEEAISTIMGIWTYQDTPGADGVKRDGSFFQHVHLLYNGAYGKSFLEEFVNLRSVTKGTKYDAPQSTRDTISTMLQGDEWMIVPDASEGGKLHWDQSVIGYNIADPMEDSHWATAGVGYDFEAFNASIGDLDSNLTAALGRLIEGEGPGSRVTGNKAFYAGDYMVHRRDNFSVNLKTISDRMRNSELVNLQNPFGYHLSQGVVFSHVTGAEYDDIVGVWDWDLIPGTTVLYHHSNLTKISYFGLRNFVGGVSDGQNGVSVMDWVDPQDQSLSYRKAWFFLDDAILVSVVNATRNNTIDQTVPIVTVLDQRLSTNDTIYINGSTAQPDAVSASSLYYGGNGYLTFGESFNLTLQDEVRTGNWHNICDTTLGAVTKKVFTSYVSHSTNLSFAMYPAIGVDQFQTEAQAPSVKPLHLGDVTGAAGKGYVALVFWPNASLAATIPASDSGWPDVGDLSVTVSNPSLVLINNSNGDLQISVSDPTQQLSSLEVSINRSNGNWAAGSGSKRGSASGQNGVVLDYDLPLGGYNGTTVSQRLQSAK